jgi:pSer/pThr/pTyr-binding forkhead associated (FHA) protein
MSLEWTLFALRVLAAVILYTFLGFAFYLIWRDLRRAAAEPDGQPAINLQLRVVNSVGMAALQAGQALPLQSVTLLGRDPGNTIVLNDGTVSDRHARVRRQDGVWWLEDLGSQSGTTLNDLPLQNPTPLSSGDVIGIGQLRFRLEPVSK